MSDSDAITIPGVYPAIRAGDNFTIANMYERVPNPRRRWWSFWRPRYVQTENLQTFRVVGTVTADT